MLCGAQAGGGQSPTPAEMALLRPPLRWARSRRRSAVEAVGAAPAGRTRAPRRWRPACSG
eukprot:1684754-Prymnesium_polylepis.1